jgi:hypothetical protein
MSEMITSGQKDNLSNVIGASARKAGGEAIDELSANGILHGGNFQQVLAQGDKVSAVVKTAVKIFLAELADNVVGRLKRLFVDRTIELASTNGEETISEASDVFTAGIYYAQKRGPSKKTKKTAVAVYEMIKDGTYSQIFGGFGENLKRLCWKESQIVALCRDHTDILRKDGYATFFLFEGENGGFFVAYVGVGDGGRLYVRVRPLEYGLVWDAMFQLRLVVPQL